MTTLFPGAIDALTNPSPSSDTVTVPHSSQHANANDAIEAIEAKVGANGSAVTTSHDYKLSLVTTTDKSLPRDAAAVTTNKTLGSGTKVTIGSDAAGDTYYRAADGSVTRVPVGTVGQVLTSDGSKPVWQAPSDVNKYAVSTGSANAYVVTLAPALGAYTAGAIVQFKANFANTGAATVNVNGLGAVSIKKLAATDLASGDISNNMVVELQYDGTNFQMQNPVGNAPLAPNGDGSALTGLLEFKVTRLAGYSSALNLTENTVFTTTVTGGVMGTNGMLHSKTPIYALPHTGASDTATVRVKFGGTTFATFVMTANTTGGAAQKKAIGYLEVWIINNASASAQNIHAMLHLSGQWDNLNALGGSVFCDSVPISTTGTIATGSNQTFTVTSQLSNSIIAALEYYPTVVTTHKNA